jgi:hypothetical protein
MNEDFLSFVWKYRLYNSALKTTSGETITVINPGVQQRNAGPDFFNARVQIGNTLWAGNVEIHVKASDWYRHNHQVDRAYGNVILHVVSEADSEIILEDMTIIPTILLAEQADEKVLSAYRHLKLSHQAIPCGKNISTVPRVNYIAWIDRMLVERLEHKSLQIEQSLQVNKGDWENAFYQLLARNFGFSVNAGPFEMLARNLPLFLLQRHRDQVHQVEALAFGQAGFFEDTKFSDEYPVMLHNEYKFLSRKYGLLPLDRHIWKTLRMRPANFPTIRISQFCSLVCRGTISFEEVRNTVEPERLIEKFNVTASPYWNTHYLFDRGSKYSERNFGITSVRNILINTVAPFLFYYGKTNGDEKYSERSFTLLQSLPAEENHILSEYVECGLSIANSYESQALIGMYHNYCFCKKCLNCSLGTLILKTSGGNTDR